MFIIVGWLILLPPGVGWDIMGYESEPLPYYPRLRNCSYYIMLNDEESPSTPQVHLPRHISNIKICSASTQISYMGWQTNFSAMVSCHLLMYSLMGFGPADSTDTSTGRYYHSLTAPHVAFIPMICLASRLWNPSKNFSISPVTTQL